jgi:hypothetical protein
VVGASDGVNTTNINVTLTELDVNEAPEYDVPNEDGYSFSYNENSADSTVIGTVSATDPEGTAVSYSIVSGDANGWFEIDSVTGVISLTPAGVAAVANDFEALANVHNLVIGASDGVNTTNINVTLTELDVNEAPEFRSGSDVAGDAANTDAYDFGGLNEGATAGTVVGTVIADDPDAGDTLSYSFEGDTLTNGVFTINATTGVITLNQDIDDADLGTFNFNVLVTDSAGLTDIAAVTIDLNNVNDAPIIISASNVFVSEEGLPNGAPDETGNTDTTNAVIASGLINLQDADGDQLTVSLSGPSGLTSGGNEIFWVWDANIQTLTGYTGTLDTPSYSAVMTIVLTAPDGGSSGNWSYNVTLLGTLDHPITTEEDVLALNIGLHVDDGTTVTDGTFTVIVEDDAPEVDIATLDGINAIGVYVGDLITTGADETYSSDLTGNIAGWNGTSVTFANSGITASGLTLFYFVDPSNPNILIGYTDTSGTASAYDASNPAQALVFTLTTNPNSDSYEFDLVQSIDSLETISLINLMDGKGGNTPFVYVSTNATGYEIDNKLSEVPAGNELIFTLSSTYTDKQGVVVEGTVNGSNNGFGVDNPFVDKGEVLKVDYAHTVSTASINFTGASLIHYKAYDINGVLLGEGDIAYGVVIGNLGAISYLELTTSAATGHDNFQFTGTTAQNIVSSSEDVSLAFDVTVIDNDGDTDTGVININLEAPIVNPIALTPNAISQLSDVDLYNDGVESDGNDILFGQGGNDLLIGGDGDDILIGGLGNDTLTGSAGSDTFVWSAGETGTDQITDFNITQDRIDLSDLLIGENSNNFGDYLSFSFSGGSTTITIDADGLGAGTASQVIVLNGVDFSGIYASSDEGTIINGLLNIDGALIIETPASTFTSPPASSSHNDSYDYKYHDIP